MEELGRRLETVRQTEGKAVNHTFLVGKIV
jgi:hypothetical protein